MRLLKFATYIQGVPKRKPRSKF